VVQVRCLCGSESRSVLGGRAVDVWLFDVVRDWYQRSGCVVLNPGPCVVLDQWVYNC
jgi:hypothetical protein